MTLINKYDIINLRKLINERSILKEIKAAFGILITPTDKIILCQNKDKPFPKKWKSPGGKAEQGETPQKTAERELNEETFLILNNYSIYKIIQIEKKDHSILFYVLKNVKLEDLKMGPELDHLEEFPRKKIEEMIVYDEILPCHAMAIQKILKELPY